ncbi:ribonuclease HII [Candidatus Pacearchaeota archaeon CG10_big_fil_rev_8_21_14_0_10_31_24]|nr:MAG: ribonuclease HII [Candidatus Pacearchaeota archaeon CG10_big_fil_rev_8_21_14_0_10_31_24]
MLIIGIDDAGRGPLIGPMILAGVLLDMGQESSLKHEGVNDSKQVAHPKRVKLAGLITDTSIKTSVIATSAEQIDHALGTGTNLNTLEAIKAAEIIDTLNKGIKENVRVIVDCPSINTESWKNTLISFIKKIDNLEISCEHKADANHISVAAASILAKVKREEEVEKLQKKYGDIGSGYPSDPTTKEFLKKNGNSLKDSGIFRKSWQTWKTLFPEKEQTTLF